MEERGPLSTGAGMRSEQGGEKERLVVGGENKDLTQEGRRRISTTPEEKIRGWGRGKTCPMEGRDARNEERR